MQRLEGRRRGRPMKLLMGRDPARLSLSAETRQKASGSRPPPAQKRRRDTASRSDSPSCRRSGRYQLSRSCCQDGYCDDWQSHGAWSFQPHEPRRPNLDFRERRYFFPPVDAGVNFPAADSVFSLFAFLVSLAGWLVCCGEAASDATSERRPARIAQLATDRLTGDTGAERPQLVLIFHRSRRCYRRRPLLASRHVARAVHPASVAPDRREEPKRRPPRDPDCRHPPRKAQAYLLSQLRLRRLCRCHQRQGRLLLW